MCSDKQTTFEKLHNIALKAPKTSGVYLWRNAENTIIYVGKAKSLKARLASYFNGAKDIKTQLLISHASSLEYIQTKNEYEALLLENTLIKKHSPKYNISLKDGKTYPMLKITKEAFPTIYRTRTIYRDGSLYFGPFPNVNNVDTFLALVKKNYKLHQCKRVKKRSAPCLYYHIGQCEAPCCGKVSEEEYNKQIKEITSILQGNTKTILKDLEAKMKKAVAEEDFEEAGNLRDVIEAINTITEKNIVEDLDFTARDYIAWASAGKMITFAVFRMRGGRLIGRDLYRVQTLKNDSEAMLEFLSVYYTEAKNVPPKIFILYAEDAELAQTWLNTELKASTSLFTSSIVAEEVSLSYYDEKTSNNSGMQSLDIAGNNVGTFGYSSRSKNRVAKITTIERCESSDRLKNSPIFQAPLIIEKHFKKKEAGHHYAALEMACFNAKEDIIARLRQTGDLPALEELKTLLKMERLPYIIEGFDIAHLQGNFTVAGMVSFKDGKPDKKNYRIFKMRLTDGIINDYKSMREAVARRYTRLINEHLELPDLILIDGGIGQVNAAWKVLQALNIDLPIIGLAEKNEEIYFPHNSKPLVLPRRSYALRLLQRVRDEVHRFSNTRVSKMNSKAKTTSIFESLPHIGKKRAEKLIKTFSSMEELRNASVIDIKKAIGVSEKMIEEIKNAIDEMS